MKTKLKNFIFNEQNLITYYLIAYSVNNLTQYYYDYFPKMLYALAYLWILCIFMYRLFITQEYLQKKEGMLSLLFIIINCLCTFIYKANWRFSVLPDFALLVFFIPVCVCTEFNEQSFTRILNIFILIYFSFSFIGLIGEVMHLPYIHAIMPDRGRGIYADIGDSGIISYVMAMVSVFFLQKNCIHQRSINILQSRYNLFHILHIIVQLWLLSITKSRTAMLGLMFCFFLIGYADIKYIYQDNAQFKRYMRIFTFLILIIGYIVIFSKYGPDRNMYSLLHGENSLLNIGSLSEEEFNELMFRFLSGRYVLWKGSIETILKSPVYGYGLKSSGFTYGFDPVIGPNSHNLILNTLLFSGMIGLLILCLMLLYFYRKMNQGYHSIEYFPLRALLYSYLISSMLDTNLLYNGKSMNVIFWIIMGYGIIRSRKMNREQ